MKKYKIFFSTSEKMSKIKNDSVDLMITSPPYWDLKNYEAEDQIGYKEDYQTYLNRLYYVWSETKRVLKKNGVAIININTKVFERKLRLLPNDFIKQMSKLNMKLRDVHYWHKSSAIPQINNFGDHFEYFLIFSKNNQIKFNKFNYFDYKYKRVKNTNIWNINKKFGSVGKKYMIHPAVFPVTYIERLIKIFTNETDTVLDPFLGSGTSLIASMLTNRKFYGFELNNVEYKNLINDRLNEYQLDSKAVEYL